MLTTWRQRVADKVNSPARGNPPAPCGLYLVLPSSGRKTASGPHGWQERVLIDMPDKEMPLRTYYKDMSYDLVSRQITAEWHYLVTLYPYKDSAIRIRFISIDDGGKAALKACLDTIDKLVETSC